MSIRHHRASGEWRHIADDREKYKAYLCSREWALLRNAVRERCGGKCERCMVNEMDCVHHLTYARKYDERIDDLAGWCNECHEFTHGKSDFDPRAPKTWVEWCSRNNREISKAEFSSLCDYWRKEESSACVSNVSWTHMLKSMVLGMAAAKKMGIEWPAKAADGEFLVKETQRSDVHPVREHGSAWDALHGAGITGLAKCIVEDATTLDAHWRDESIVVIVNNKTAFNFLSREEVSRHCGLAVSEKIGRTVSFVVELEAYD